MSCILHMWIPRDVEARLKRSAKTRPVIVLTGASQTGKTSTFRHLFPNYAVVSLDLPTEAEQAEKEPERFLQRNLPPVIIDEVQYAPGLFRHLKVAVDAHRTENGQFLLTGSQKFTLMIVCRDPGSAAQNGTHNCHRTGWLPGNLCQPRH